MNKEEVLYNLYNYQERILAKLDEEINLVL
jgi:hypothetical protein